MIGNWYTIIQSFFFFHMGKKDKSNKLFELRSQSTLRITNLADYFSNDWLVVLNVYIFFYVKQIFKVFHFGLELKFLENKSKRKTKMTKMRLVLIVLWLLCDTAIGHSKLQSILLQYSKRIGDKF